ncbi:MAG: carbamate kinase [Pirellulaceae bacterium]
MERIVVVFGGNAFAAGRQLTMAGQLEYARQAIELLAPLLHDEVQLLISHGNGPQVGAILIRVEEALGKAYPLPLEACVAESEGELGYVLAQALYNVTRDAGRTPPIVSMLSQVVVDADDPAFATPTKPIGPFLEASQSERLRDDGVAVVEDAGRGFRRVVASPEPREVLELEVIRKLLELGVIVIAAGGGGIPVVRGADGLIGVEAVIDKDLTAALLADQLEARQLIILTCVPCAYRCFNTPRQEPIGRVTAEEAQSLLAEGHFAPGSMRPKIEAAIRFASRPCRRTIICDPPSLADALQGLAGTIIETKGQCENE